MRLLILTFNLPPDLSPVAFRMRGLLAALEAYRTQGLEVEVITTRPSHYATFAADAPPFEDRGWLRIHRIDIPPHKSRMFDRARSYRIFAREARRIAGRQRRDAVFATSSRLMTADLGASIARRSGSPLYLDIRDLFTDTMKDLLAGSPMRLLMPAFRVIEGRAFRAAERINVVSEGFLPHMRAVAPDAEYRLFTNGIDPDFLAEDFGPGAPMPAEPVILYAGNMGEGQGLDAIIPDAARLMKGKARFRLIGDGGRREQLASGVAGAGVDNVEIVAPMPRAALMDEYRNADILFLHLADQPAFRKVLPSKLFELVATGKPVLAGVAGCAAEFLGQVAPDAAIFPPGDARGLAAAVGKLVESPLRPDRTAFRRDYARQSIMEAMAKDLWEFMAAP